MTCIDHSVLLVPDTQRIRLGWRSKQMLSMRSECNSPWSSSKMKYCLCSRQELHLCSWLYSQRLPVPSPRETHCHHIAALVRHFGSLVKEAVKKGKEKSSKLSQRTSNPQNVLDLQHLLHQRCSLWDHKRTTFRTSAPIAISAYMSSSLLSEVGVKTIYWAIWTHPVVQNI